VSIPPPGSQLPSLKEWTDEAYPVRIAGVTPLKCDAKMLREWLRIRCTENRKGILIEVSQEEPLQVRAFKFKGNGVGELQMQVVRGTNYTGSFGWQLDGSDTGATFSIRWPSAQDRPTVALKEDTYQ
jgi:hypothetical protein